MPSLMQTVFYVFHFFRMILTNWTIPVVEILRHLDIFGVYRQVRPDDSDIPRSLVRKVCIMTGGTRGIGREVVKVMLMKGCSVITGSSADSAERQLRHQQIMDDVTGSKGTLEILPLDLSSLDSVKRFAEDVLKRKFKIDFIICNAGVMFASKFITNDGVELHWAVNYLSHVMLTWLLLPKLTRSNPHEMSHRKSRIVLVSSAAHRAAGGFRFKDFNYDKLWSPHHACGRSKAALIMFGYKLNQWLVTNFQHDYITVNSLHPGIVLTGLNNNLSALTKFLLRNMPITRSVQDGGGDVVWASMSWELEMVSGSYFEDCAKRKSSRLTRNKKKQDLLWKWTWDFLSRWCNETPLPRTDLLNNNNNFEQEERIRPFPGNRIYPILENV